MSNVKTPAEHQAQAEDTAREIQMRMQYLGTLKILADCSILLGDGTDAEDMRETFERVFSDAQKVITRLRWRRILQRFEIELVDEDDYEQCPHGNDLVPGEDASCGCRGPS